MYKIGYHFRFNLESCYMREETLETLSDFIGLEPQFKVVVQSLFYTFAQPKQYVLPFNPFPPLLLLSEMSVLCMFSFA